MKAHRTLLLSLVAAFAVSGLGFLSFRFFPRATGKKTQAIEAEPEISEPEDEGFRDCPDDAEEHMASEPVQEPAGAFCIPTVLAFDQPIGPIHAQMSLESLQAACGEVFADYLFYLGEGQCQWGTAMYHGTPREVQIAWRNWKDRKSPSFVHFVGHDLRFPNGFGPGMFLKDVAKLNGRPLTLAGFGWDASGLHRSFQGGNLRAFDEAGEAHYLIRYTLDWDLFDTASDEEHASIVTGEGLLESTLPALEKFKARVDFIEYVFAAEARAAADNRDRCRALEAFAAKTYTGYNAKLVQDLFFTTLKEPGCDEGILAETATDIVSRALVDDFDATLAYAESDTRVGIFLLTHINSSTAHNDLERILKQRDKCQNRPRGLCNNLMKEVEKNLTTP